MTIPQTAPRDTRTTSRRGLLPLAGTGFVAAVLAGNSLTESVSGSGTLGHLAAQAGSTTARTGLALELIGFVLLLVFVAEAVSRSVSSTASRTALLAGGAAVAVKLASGAAVLGALHRRAELDEAAATALVATNDAAFVLFWLGYGVFATAIAVALAASGVIGRALRWSGILLGTLTVASGVLGSVTGSAVPIPFLLTLLWTAALGVRLTARIGSAPAEAETIGG